MENNVLFQSSKVSIIIKLISSFNFNNGIRKCKHIEEFLRNNDILKKQDDSIKLIIDNKKCVTEECKYIFFKGYNKDGSIKPLKKYKLFKGQVIKDEDTINIKVNVIDLYEKSIYLYMDSIEEEYISGYLIRELKNSKKGKILILTSEKTKVNVKNINRYISYDNVDEFIDKVIL